MSARNFFNRGVNSDSIYMDPLVTSTLPAATIVTSNMFSQTYIDVFNKIAPTPRIWTAMIGLTVPVLCYLDEDLPR